MKKSLFAFAALAALAAMPAVAQVSVFGVVDASIRRVDDSNAASAVNSVSSGGNTSNRWGLKGTEDLGAGLKASFHLESGFTENGATDSTGPGLFNRRSTLSLAGSLGEVRLGRDFVPTYVARTAFDPFNANGVASLSTVIGASSTPSSTTRANNMVSYFSPMSNGFSGQLSVAMRETDLNNKYVGGRIAYANGPIAAQVGYGVNDVAPNVEFKQTTVGGSYDFGAAKLMGSWTNGKQDAMKTDTYSMGAVVPFGAGQFMATVAKLDASTGDTDLYALGYVHNLSKRTAVYGTAAHHNKPVGSADSFEMGVRHSF